MKASEVITHIAQLIAIYGDKEVVVGDTRSAVCGIGQDHKDNPMSTDEMPPFEVFTIYVVKE